MQFNKMFVFTIVAVLLSTVHGFGANRRDSRELVSPLIFKKIVDEKKCSMVTDEDRQNFSEFYRDLAEKAEKDKLPAICDSAVEEIESLRIQLSTVSENLACLRGASNPLKCNDTLENATYQLEVLTSEMFGSDAEHEGKIEFAMRVCPKGATKLKRLLLGLEVGMGLAQFAVPELWIPNAILNWSQQAWAIRQKGVTPMRVVDVGLSVGKRFYPNLSYATRLRKGFRILTGWVGLRYKHQFVDKLVACKANKVAQDKQEKSCTTQSLEQNDLIQLRDAYLRLSDSRIDKGAQGFCQQTACLWSYGAKRTDKNWRKNTEALFSELPAPTGPNEDEKGKPIDYDKELHDALGKVEDWRDKCSKISEYVVSCEVSCRTRPGQQVPSATLPGSEEDIFSSSDGVQ